MIEDLSFQDKLDLLEGTKWNRRLRSKPNVIDVQRQSGTAAITANSSQQRQSGTAAGSTSSTQYRQSSTAAVAPSSSQQGQSGTTAVAPSSSQQGQFQILSNKIEMFLEFGLTCTKLMRARSSWSIVQAVKLDLPIPEIKFESFE